MKLDVVAAVGLKNKLQYKGGDALFKLFYTAQIAQNARF